MVKSYAVRRTIEASPDRVWELLSDPATYSTWNPTVVSIQGRMALGSKIDVVSTVNPKRTFTVKITELDGPRRMVWSDGMPLGLFSGVRTYSLDPVDEGTDFHMEEVYSGLLSGLIVKSIPDLNPSFEEFADGLKAAAEARD